MRGRLDTTTPRVLVAETIAAASGDKARPWTRKTLKRARSQRLREIALGGLGVYWLAGQRRRGPLSRIW